MEPFVKEHKVTFRAYLLMAEQFLMKENTQNAEEFIRKAIVIHNLIKQGDVINEDSTIESQIRQEKLLFFKKWLRELKGEPEPTEPE